MLRWASPEHENGTSVSATHRLRAALRLLHRLVAGSCGR
jgi:hypothetical protein